MAVSKNPWGYNCLAPEALSENYLFGDRYEWICREIKNTHPKRDNFMRMFGDYTYQTNSTPTISDFDYGLSELKEVQEELRTDFKRAQSGLARNAATMFGEYV